MPTAVDRLGDRGRRPRRQASSDELGPARRRRTRRGRGTASTAATAGGAIGRRSVSRSSTTAARTLVVPTSMTRIAVTSSRPPGTRGRTPRAAQLLAEEAAEQPGDEDDGEVEHRREPSHIVAADQPDHDEHGLGDDVRADGGDQAVAERRADPLHPRRAAGAEDEADDGAERQPRRPAPESSRCRPPSGRRARTARRTPGATSAAGADGVPVPAHVSASSARPRRRAERRRQAELARVEDAVRVERVP